MSWASDFMNWTGSAWGDPTWGNDASAWWDRQWNTTPSTSTPSTSTQTNKPGEPNKPNEEKGIMDSPYFWPAAITSAAGMAQGIFGGNATRDANRYSVDVNAQLTREEMAQRAELAEAANALKAEEIAAEKKKILLDAFAKYMQFLHNAAMPEIDQFNRMGERMGGSALSAQNKRNSF